MRISDWSSDVCSSDLAGAGSDDLVIGPQGGREALREKLPELLVETGNAELDALRLAHQPIDLLQRLCQRLQLREVDAGQVLRLVDQHVCFVLERLDLVVDLLEGARGCQQVLAVVAGLEHGDLRLAGKSVGQGKSW